MKKIAVAFALFLPAAAVAQVPDAGFRFYTVPGVVNASGLNDTRFVSDVAVTNPGPQDAFLYVGFVPAGALSPQMLSLPAGATVVWRNALQELWGSSGAGALSIGTDQKLILRARTYNTAASGTFGVALPVYDADGFILPGGRAHSLWVSQSADPLAGYRTNVAVVFPDAGGGRATVTVFDAGGGILGRQDYALDAAGFQQFSVGSFAGAAPVARAEIEVTAGHAAAYAVVVDNVTGDSSLFTFESLPAGIQDVVVNGVARANGRNATFFRTDGRFFNPGATDATVRVAFHANQTSNPSPVTRDFVIPAGKIRDVVDVLDSLLGLPVGSAGALRFTSDAPVAFLCRTSNVDPAGARPGTYGAQQKPVPLLSFLSSADEGALITGLRQNAAFRTNVGFAAGEDGASWTLTLRDKTGATLATAAGGLGPFGWTQPNVQDLFPAHSIPDDAALQVKLTSGSLDVFDSSIDNASGDPVVTAIALLPTEIPSSATIGPAGGSVRSADGSLTLKIPAGALASPTTVSIVPADGVTGPDETGTPMRILPDGLTLARPALLVRSYVPADLNGVALEGLSLAVSDGSSWYALTGGSIDVSRRTLSVPFDSLVPPTGSRQALASSAGGGWVVTGYGGYHVSPHDFLVVEGSKNLCLQLYGFDVTSTGSGKTEKIRLGPRHAVSATWFKDGSPVSDGSTSSGYCLQPPACAPFNGIMIRADFGFQSSLEVYVVVYPRNWNVEIEQYIQIEKCEGLDTPDIPVFKSGTWLKRSFTINDDLTFSATGPENNAGILREYPTLCPYLGTECHFTRIEMGFITSGPIQSISRGRLNWVYANVKVQFPQQAIPSLTWSNYSCKDLDHISLFPGFDSTPRTEEWPLWKPPNGWGFDPGPAKAPFMAIPQVVSTQSFLVRILPASSPSCPR